MKDFAAIATLVVVGVIIADVLIHPEGVKAGGNVLTNILGVSFTSMLGSVPNQVHA